jgi:hypothetical protein
VPASEPVVAVRAWTPWQDPIDVRTIPKELRDRWGDAARFIGRPWDRVYSEALGGKLRFRLEWFKQ